MHFQAYLLEGIVRWNEDRETAAVEGASGSKTHTYNSALRHEVNRLSRMVYGTDVDDYYRDPASYTGSYENYLS